MRVKELKAIITPIILFIHYEQGEEDILTNFILDQNIT